MIPYDQIFIALLRNLITKGFLMTKNFFKNQINPFLILRCHKSCCNNKHTTSLIRLFDARLIMKVEEGVVR